MNNNILASLKQSAADESAVNDVVGIVMVNEELLNQVSGAISAGFYYSISGECQRGFRCDVYNWF